MSFVDVILILILVGAVTLALKRMKKKGGRCSCCDGSCKVCEAGKNKHAGSMKRDD